MFFLANPTIVKRHKTEIHVDYFSYVGRYLINKYPNQIERALLETCTSLRREKLKLNIRNVARSDYNKSWKILFEYLDHIENSCEKIISKHTVAYWMHLYRRIRPFLHPKMPSKTDYATVFLVREISDLMFTKFGKLEGNDLDQISNFDHNTLLGGLFANSSKFYGTDPKELFDALSKNSIWVMSKFDINDYFEIYRLESLFYEYWRTTATLRIVGKGANSYWNSDIDWLSYEQSELSDLIRTYDIDAVSISSSMFTLLGNWIKLYPPEDAAIVEATYNHSNLDNDYNFNISIFDPNKFYSQIEYMSEDFYEKNKIRLDVLISTISALSMYALGQRAMIDGAKFDQSDTYMINLRQRAYAINSWGRENFINFVHSICTNVIKVECEEIEIKNCIDFITLSDDRSKISGWGRGKSYVVIPYNDNWLINIASIHSVLDKIFVHVRERGNKKGYKFEDALIKELQDNNFSIVKQGKFKSKKGEEREAEAIVRVNNRLFILECVSIGRPIDWEISKPKVYLDRNLQLEKKCVQASTCAEFVNHNRSDLTFVKPSDQIDWIVLSPIPEFMWTKEFPCYNGEQKKIMHIEELISFLKSL